MNSWRLLDFVAKHLWAKTFANFAASRETHELIPNRHHAVINDLSNLVEALMANENEPNARARNYRAHLEMKEIKIKKYVQYLFGASILLFVLNKLYLRPWILENDFSGLVMILTYSVPNLVEAIIGTLILTGILLQIYQSFIAKKRTIKARYIHLIAVLIAAVYVISQELKFHNTGGNNIYDPYDLIASLIGLIGTFAIIRLFGFRDNAAIDLKRQE